MQNIFDKGNAIQSSILDKKYNACYTILDKNKAGVVTMNHALLKSVIYDQHEFIRNFQIVPRDYEFEENGNYVLVGLRRAGKSTLLYKIVLDLVASGVDWEQIIYINFEDERLSEFTVADFNDLLSVQSEMSDKKGYFFLDEVQNIDGWEKLM